MMVETAAHLANPIFPRLPVRQWVLSVPKCLHEHIEQNPANVTTADRAGPGPAAVGKGRCRAG